MPCTRSTLYLKDSDNFNVTASQMLSLLSILSIHNAFYYCICILLQTTATTISKNKYTSPFVFFLIVKLRKINNTFKKDVVLRFLETPNMSFTDIYGKIVIGFVKGLIWLLVLDFDSTA